MSIKLTKRQKTSRARRLLRLRAQGKAAYTKADALMTELLDAGVKVGETFPLPGDRKVVMVDNFTDDEGKLKNKVFRSHGTSRYELEVIEA